jgi:glycyl-tRNA synthetase beta chain
MYWRAGKPERFVRPVRWVVALLDSAIVPLEIAGIAPAIEPRPSHPAWRSARGSSTHAPKSMPRAAQSLCRGRCGRAPAHHPQGSRRRGNPHRPGARWREDEPLVETVVHLTEWPSVILGNFEPEYLALPEEVLVTVMRDHQKYFAVEGPDGKLLPHFLAVLNTQVDEEGKATIQHGNQKVLRARFKDAQFFWDFDQKIAA